MVRWCGARKPACARARPYDRQMHRRQATCREAWQGAIDKGAVSAPTGDPKLDIVQPAVEGTKTVLRAAAKHKGDGLQRVVVTSSVCGGCYVRPADARATPAEWCAQGAPLALISRSQSRPCASANQLTCPAPRPPICLSCGCCAAIHDMNRKQQPKQEQYCEEDWNSVSTIDTEAYWVSKVRHRAHTHTHALACLSTHACASHRHPASVQGCGCVLRLPSDASRQHRTRTGWCRSLMPAWVSCPVCVCVSGRG